MKELSINKAVFNELVSGILSIIPSGLSAIILYGSVARGTDQHDSDVDVALIIERPMSTEQNDKLSDFIVDMDLKYDKVFSVGKNYFFIEDTFEVFRYPSPFIHPSRRILPWSSR